MLKHPSCKHFNVKKNSAQYFAATLETLKLEKQHRFLAFMSNLDL